MIDLLHIVQVFQDVENFLHCHGVITFEASGQIVASCRWVGGRFEGGYTIHHGYTHSWRTLKDMRMGLGVAAAERKMGPFAA